MSKLYYFAHPYTGDGTEEDRISNYEKAIWRTIELLKAGINIINPVVYTHPLDINSDDMFNYNYWMEFDKILMDRCDGIILAPGWEQSKGCVVEKEYFEKQGKLIMYYEKLIK